MKRFALLVLLCTALVGCSNDGLAPVSGKVTLDGKPVPGAIVTFTPTAPGGSYSLGKTDSDGIYRLEFSQDKKGAMIGEHKVEIVVKKISKADLPDDGSVTSPPEPIEIPAKYRKPGALTANVENKSNTIDFALTK